MHHEAVAAKNEAITSSVVDHLRAEVSGRDVVRAFVKPLSQKHLEALFFFARKGQRRVSGRGI